MTGSFTATLLYDRYHKKRAQQKWCNLVSHLADEPLPTTTLPRRITIFLAAPPGDSIRAAREHFHDYVKPILVAGALDWEVVEGRREGEVRAGLAEKIRKLRKRHGEGPQVEPSEEDSKDESSEQLLYELRQKTGIEQWNGVQGDLILGRHTWKEYVRGLHEGWLGPLSLKETEALDLRDDSKIPERPSPDQSSADPTGESPSPNSSESPETPAPKPSPAKPPKPPPTSPYITPADYSSCSISSILDDPMNPSLPLPLPHLLGFLNTPRRLYRFLTRRQLADSTGRSVAALVLATQSRSYNQSANYASAIDPDESSPSAGTSSEVKSIALVKETWEQEATLREEERDWHKSAWKANDPESETQERVWQEPMVIDNRIGQRMRKFELPSDEDENAIRIDAQKRQEAASIIQKLREWTGWSEREKKGWEMGLEGADGE